MLQDIRKSINNSMNDRITSPFYGTLILSWCIWNWDILYLLFWEEEEISFTMKLHFIHKHLFNYKHGVLYPILSTAIILTIGNLISNAAFWLNLEFEQWKYTKKQNIEGKKLLSFEDSLRIRGLISETEERYGRILENRENEIKNYKLEIENANLKNFNENEVLILTVVSDHTTIFLNSPTYQEISTNVPVHVYNNSDHYWNSSPFFFELQESFWVAHTELIEDIEAIEGGYYFFQKTFDIPSQPKGILSAIIYFIIDDHCVIKINNVSTRKYSGFNDLHSLDITDSLKSGNNILTFEVQNNNNLGLRNPNNNRDSGEKGKINPYGLRYKIKIKYFKNQTL